MRLSFLRTSCSIAAGVLFFSQAVSPADWAPAFKNLPRPVVRITPPHPWIALTFDDGPHPQMTERLLALLANEKVSATFFVVGKMADRYPYLVQEISAGGHEVSNHSYNHIRFSTLSPHDVVSELSRTRDVIRRLTGKDSTFFRPPGGHYSKASVRAASRAGFHMVLWSTITKDVEGASTRAISFRILHGAQDGAIILMHSGIQNTLEALPEVIATLRAQGYEFVTVSTLMNRTAPARLQPAPLPLHDVAHHVIAGSEAQSD
jgi:peptidoglycan/xylan/chitin deacetylase (PgdA/CDA1 family)